MDPSSLEYQLIFRNREDSANLYYLIASRCIYSYYNNSEFRIREIYDGRITSNYYSFSGKEKLEGVNANESIRPIVFLKSTLKTNGKNASGAWNIIDK